DVASHDVLNGLALAVRDDLRSDGAGVVAVTLKQAHDNRLAASARPGDAPLAHVLVHVLRQAADESLVGLNCAAHLLLERTRLHRKADAVKHEPSGLLRDADCAMHFVRTDAVLAVRDHRYCREPFAQTERRVLENRSHFNSEL